MDQRGRRARATARPSWEALAQAQDGVVSRRQLLRLGLSESTIASLRDSGRWVCALPGVYLTFTGPVPATARAWAAVLYASTGSDDGPVTGVGDAALAGTTALWLFGVLDAPPEVMTVLVPHGRKVRPQRGLSVSRCRDLPQAQHPAALPPRVRLERAVLDVAAGLSRPEAVVDLVLRATQRRLTTPSRLRAALASRPRHRWRTLVQDLLEDAEDGVASPLERRWARDVERRHRLPTGVRNRPEAPRGGRSRRYRDVRYDPWGVVTELDGREAHPDHERFRDRARDNEAAVDGDVPLRYGMREVAGDPCGCAAQLATVLTARGWRGTPRRCGPTCAVG